MFLILFLLLISLMATLDWRRHTRTGGRITSSLVALLVLDALPLLTTLLGHLIDNTPTAMRILMWLTWGWLLYILVRLCYHTFAALRLRAVGILLGAIVTLLFLWGALVGRTDLRITEVEFCSERLPASFDGMRIAHFTDLHLGALVCQEREVRTVVETLNTLEADLVCFTGDLVNIRYSELDPLAMELLGAIEAPVYSILGNHDVGSYIRKEKRLPAAVSTERLIARQEQMGWHLLQDTTLYLTRGADSISLTGLSYDPTHWKERHDADLPFMGGDRAYRGVDPRLYNLTLVHVPQLWEAICAKGFGDLTLAGHTHAMQLKIPLGKGRFWSPAAWLYERWSGHYAADGKQLYINDGIGYVGYPMRLGAHPEITLITLKRCK